MRCAAGFVCLAVMLVGCDDGTTPALMLDPIDAGVDAELLGDGSLDAPDAEPDGELDEAIEPSEADWCSHQPVGARVGGSVAVQWSAAHALTRFFGAHGGSPAVDDALTDALDVPTGGGLGDGARLAAYAEALPFVCAIEADVPAPLGPATVELVDGVAYVRPGIGPVAVPAEAIGVVLDLRDLPAVEGLGDALRAAAEATLSAPLPQTIEARTINGLPDEVFSPQSPYTAAVTSIAEDPWPGAAPDRPLAVWIERPPPAAAALAGAIRLAGAGWLLGESLFSGVAESEIMPVGEGALAIRWGTRLDAEGAPWPDVIAPDARDDARLAALFGEAIPPPRARDASRPGVEAYAPHGLRSSRPPGPGARQAMLITAHGTARRFFPYFDVVGDVIDERLEETLATLDDDGLWTRANSRALLRRFAEAIADGHAFVLDGVELEGRPAPIAVDHLEDEAPVIKRSTTELAQAGDIITAIDGRPAPEWYANEIERTSAASRGYALDLASRRFLTGLEPLDLTLQDIAGASRQVALPRVAFDEVPSRTPWLHPSGFLDAFEAPEVLYINMADDVEDDAQAFIARLMEQMPRAEALIVDMRGYPGAAQYQVALMITGGADFASPIFEVPVWSGPHRVNRARSQLDAAAFGGQRVMPFVGPVALLVGPTSVSAAENFSMMLTPLEQVTVVGRPSAATNGNITGVWLPGGLALTLTGMSVYFPDGSPFHGIGIVPDIEIWPTAEALAQGRDDALGAAIEHVQGQR